MATIVRSPQSLCFSSDVPDIVFNTADGSGTLTFDLILDGERENLFSETLHTIDGSMSLTDLSSLLEGYARQYLTIGVECSFTDSQGTARIDPFTVLYAVADVDTTAQDFVQHHFLTTLSGEKDTASGRKELLHAYDSSEAVVNARVLRGGWVVDLSADLAPFTEVNGHVYSFDASPDEVRTLLALSETDMLLSYVVSAGARYQAYRVSAPDEVPPSPVLLFVNSFGCQEYFYCTGTHKKESKYDRQSVRIGSRLRNYRITEDRQFTANTGYLSPAMADWADELFRSEEVRLWIDGSAGREVVITDSKSEIRNSDDDRPAFEFTYTYAQRLHNVMNPTRGGRIFDNTFDHTFE